MTQEEKTKRVNEFEEFLTNAVNAFQFETELIVDDLYLEFEGVRVELFDEEEA